MIKSERELSTMISSMSHDLRTPLTALLGYIQLLEKGNMSEKEGAQYIRIIKKRAEQLNTLIQSFFCLSIVHSNKESLKLEELNLNKSIQTCALDYYDAFIDNGQRVVLNLPEDSYIIMGNQVATLRIIENLLLNALKHGGEEITIELNKKDAEVVFSVKNRLEPTQEVELNRVFDRLYTTDQAREHHRGLGLPIVKRLMEQMHGDINAYRADQYFLIECRWPVISS